MTRQLCIVVLALIGLAPPVSAAPEPTARDAPRAVHGVEAQGHSHEHTDSPQRLALLVEAEHALMKGDATSARKALDAAALMSHSLDTELLLVRTMMQAGEYRHAAGFAAHVAGGHVEDGAMPAALYAWLLFLGGQGKFGLQTLEESIAHSPPDPVANEAHQLIGDDQTPPSGSLLALPHRFAPYAVMVKGEAPPAQARAVGNGMLWNGGSEALVPLAVLGDARHCWVRNGLGQTVAATVTRKVDNAGFALLALAASLPMATDLLALREPFAGSPGFVADYPVTTGAGPAWPRVHPGFLGGATASSPLRRLGIPVRKAPRGGPVFNAAGKLAGFSLKSAADADIFLTLSQLRSTLGSPAGGPAPATPVVPIGLDEGYEHAMQLALQIIVAD